MWLKGGEGGACVQMWDCTEQEWKHDDSVGLYLRHVLWVQELTATLKMEAAGSVEKMVTNH